MHLSATEVNLLRSAVRTYQKRPWQEAALDAETLSLAALLEGARGRGGLDIAVRPNSRTCASLALQYARSKAWGSSRTAAFSSLIAKFKEGDRSV
jgi:hypothetical protein